MISYYFLLGTNITAFPHGFRMIAGDANRRTSSLEVPEPDKSFWGPKDKTQDALSQKAIGFNCLNYTATAIAEGALTRHYLPDRSLITSQCKDGLRLELMFPSCWDGVNADTPDHHSHLAYPDLVMGGQCPPGYTARVPALYYETIWNTSVFNEAEGQFALSNGDKTGFSYHGDFLNGWDRQILQEAVETCTDLSGNIEACSVFQRQDSQVAKRCTLHSPRSLLLEHCAGPRNGLCGNITI
jgi:hypothetical protein